MEFLSEYESSLASSNDSLSETVSYSDEQLSGSLPDALLSNNQNVQVLFMDHNLFVTIPSEISQFSQLVTLDFSDNMLKSIPEDLLSLPNLEQLILRNNLLDSTSFPATFSQLSKLTCLNISGNHLIDIPNQVLELENLQSLHIGANKLRSVPNHISKLQRLHFLYLGGNEIDWISSEIGSLINLTCLVLSDNKLTCLPSEFSELTNLKSLSLHNNLLQTLPPELVSLNLFELSLRNNPLIVKFVQELSFDVPSLKETAARYIVNHNIPFHLYRVPKVLTKYLTSARRCVNPSCKGVYFTYKAETIKFVDFCGKYRLPFLEYLCAPDCSTARPKFSELQPQEVVAPDEEDSSSEDESRKLRKVLLG